MNKIFLVFLSITLINTMTYFSNRDINNQTEDIEKEVVEENLPSENTNIENETEEAPEDNTNTGESSLQDEQESQNDEVRDEIVEESPEEDSDVLPDMDIELTDEEKALVFKYIGKLDINYLMNLAGENITEDEKILIIEHLKERLTEEEFSEVEDLIIRFLYTLE